MKPLDGASSFLEPMQRRHLRPVAPTITLSPPAEEVGHTYVIHPAPFGPTYPKRSAEALGARLKLHVRGPQRLPTDGSSKHRRNGGLSIEMEPRDKFHARLPATSWPRDATLATRFTWDDFAPMLQLVEEALQAQQGRRPWQQHAGAAICVVGTSVAVAAALLLGCLGPDEAQEAATDARPQALQPRVLWGLSVGAGGVVLAVFLGALARRASFRRASSVPHLRHKFAALHEMRAALAAKRHLNGAEQVLAERLAEALSRFSYTGEHLPASAKLAVITLLLLPTAVASLPLIWALYPPNRLKVSKTQCPWSARHNLAAVQVVGDVGFEGARVQRWKRAFT